MNDSKVDEVVALFPYVSRDDIEKDLAITKDVQRTVNRLLDNQLHQPLLPSVPTVGAAVLHTRHDDITLTDELPDLTAPLSSASTSSVRQSLPGFSDNLPDISAPRRFLFACDPGPSTADGIPNYTASRNSPSPQSIERQFSEATKKRQFVFRHISKPVKNDFYSDSSDVELDSELTAKAYHDNADPRASSSRSGLTHSSAAATAVHSISSDADCSQDTGQTYSEDTTQYTGLLPQPKTEWTEDSADLEADNSQGSQHSTQDSYNESQEKRRKVTNPAARSALAEKRAAAEALCKRKIEERQSAREAVKRAKMSEKKKKQRLAAVQRQIRPGECMKFITAIIDPGVLKSPGGATILEALSQMDVKFEIQPQVAPNIITYWREVTEASENGAIDPDTETSEVVQEEVLLVLSESELIQLVESSTQVRHGITSETTDTLTTFVARRKSLLQKNITVICHNLDKYLRDKTTQGRRDHREATMVGTGEAAYARKRKPVTCVDITKLDLEEAILDLQMQTGSVIRLLSSDSHLGRLVAQYTRSVAETPYKRGRLQTGMSFHVEKKGCVRLEKDGRGISQLWRKQLQQLKSVGAEMVNALLAAYPTPAQLFEAYEFMTQKEGEALLQDIIVRRGAGVLATSRRIGKEISRRIYQLMTVKDPEFILK